MIAAKARVRDSFARAAAAYDAAAEYQREVGAALLTNLPFTPEPRRIIDVGCGTGHGTGLLARRWPRADIVAVDFALAMTRQVPGALRLCADAEALPLANASVDLYWSSLTLQWCEPQRYVAEAARVLRPGGVLAVSTLGPQTFAELRQAFAGVDDYRHTLDFSSADALQALFAQSGLRLCALLHQPVVQHHENVAALLGAVRQLGANHVVGGNRRPGLMGRDAWQRFVDNYESLRGERGLPLSYETLLLYAEKT